MVDGDAEAILDCTNHTKQLPPNIPKAEYSSIRGQKFVPSLDRELTLPVVIYSFMNSG
jgi:hypothetical protein